MNTSETLHQLSELKLRGMAMAYQAQLDLPMDQHLEAHEMVAQLTQSAYEITITLNWQSCAFPQHPNK